MKEYLAECAVDLVAHQEAIDTELNTRVSLLTSFHHALPEELRVAAQDLGWRAS